MSPRSNVAAPNVVARTGDIQAIEIKLRSGGAQEEEVLFP